MTASLVVVIPVIVRSQSPTVQTPTQVKDLKEAKQLSEQFIQLKRQGKYSQAIPLAQSALAIWEKVLGPNHLIVATSLDILAGLYQDQGNYAAAEPLYKRSLAIFEKALGPDHPNIATSLNHLAGLYHDQGNYAAAEPLHKRSLIIWEKALGPDHLIVATSLNNLAELYQDQGNYAAAEPLYKRSLAIWEKALGPDHLNVATSLNNLAALYKAQGNYAAVEPLYKRSLAIFEKALGPDHPDVATSLNNLATLYLEQGNYAAAELLYKRSLAIWGKALGPDHPNVAQSLNNLAALYQDQGNYAAVEPLHKRSLAIWEKALGPDHPNVAQSLNNLAELYRNQGNYAAVEPLYKRSLAIFEKALGPDHPNVATSLNNLAALYQEQGNYAAAEPLYKQSLAIFEKALGPDHANVAQSLNNLAALYKAQGNNTLAHSYLQKGLQAEERTLTLNLSGGSEKQKQLYLQTFSGTQDYAISLHLQDMLQDTVAARLALTTILQRKGRILDLLSSNQQLLRQNLKSEDQTLFDSLSNARRQLANLTFNQPEKLSPEQYKNQINQLEDQINQLEDQLSRRSAEFRAQIQPITLEAIQRLIPANTALVEFVVYKPVNPKTSAGKSFGTSRYAAYILKSQGDPQGIDLGEADKIDQAITAFRRNLQDSQTLPEEIKVSARKVDALTMQRLRNQLGSIHTLLLSPDGLLNLIPFEALVDETNHYLVEANAFTYLSSGRDLLRLETPFASQQPPLLLADPFFDKPGMVVAQTTPENSKAPTRSIDLTQQSFPPLKGTEDEVNAILPLLKNHYPGTRSLMGAQASKSAIEQVKRPQILHIATHGFFETPTPPKAGSATTLTDNPLLFSGLVLAGFKLKPPTPDDNGILTAMEVTGINLLGTKLVVLSACNTGAGKLSTGEGVYGLRRALVIAGAESQLFSLWRIDDGFTPKLMETYYKKLLARSGRSDALRQTQLDLLKDKDYSHPYYWASFIFLGNQAPLF